jgi:hypothetical protein
MNKIGPGEEKVLVALTKLRERQKNSDIREVIGRLSTPRVARPLSPTPGERIIMAHNLKMQARRCDLKRIEQLAVPAIRRDGPPATDRFRQLTKEMPQPVSEEEHHHQQEEGLASLQGTSEQTILEAALVGRAEEPACRGASGGSYFGGGSTALETNPPSYQASPNTTSSSFFKPGSAAYSGKPGSASL